MDDFIKQAKQAGYSDAQIQEYFSKTGQTAAQTTPTAPTNDHGIQPGNWDTFVKGAAQIAKERDFPLAVLLGQAALESGRGTAAPGNNYFGIKGSGNAGNNNLPTQEYGANGYYGENSNFAAYNSAADSINAYIDFLQKNPRYAKALTLKSDPDAMLAAIREAGYATSPTYVQSVQSTPEYQAFRNGGY